MTAQQPKPDADGQDPAPAITSGSVIRSTTASAVDDLVAKIRGLISDQGLKVGDNLPTERELCERFQASRNTVREAMRILKAYGIVTVRPKVGATIIDDRMERAIDLFAFNTLAVSKDTFIDIQGFRALLEVASVDLLFDRISEDDIAALDAANDGLLEAADAIEASEIDFRFHTSLIEIIGNKAILDVYKIMKPVILKIMVLGKTRKTFSTTTHAEHRAIVDALRRRDRLAYQFRMKTHLDGGFTNFDS